MYFDSNFVPITNGGSTRDFTFPNLIDVRYWEQFVPKMAGPQIENLPQLFLEFEAEKSQ